MYLTYEDYINMGGTLPAPEFERFEFKARTLVNGSTNNRFGKLSELPEELKRLIYELVELLPKQCGGAVQSERQAQGEVSQSVAYASGTVQTAERLIYTYLHEVKINGAPALYRGPSA